MFSWLENLYADMLEQILTLLEEGKITLPYEATLLDAEDEFLGNFRMNVDGTFTVLNEGSPKLEMPAFPVTVHVKDVIGNRHEITWTPPSIQ